MSATYTTPSGRRSKREIEASPEKPSTLPVNPDGIPAELKARPQWVCWRWQRRNERWTKVPVDPRTGSSAKANDRSTWGDFGDTLKRYQAQPDKYAGIGYEFDAADPFAGVDFDDARDPATGDIDPWAAELLQALDGYAEVSPSGTGAKAIVRAAKLAGACTGYSDGHKVEVYDRGRFFALTGHTLPGSRADVPERQATFDAVYRRLFSKPDSGRADQTPKDKGRPDDNALYHSTGKRPLRSVPYDRRTDDDILQRASVAKNGAKFRALWDGDTSGHGDDHSRADASLCTILAQWCRGDKGRVDRLFRRSGLMRPKWDERHAADGSTYGTMTVRRACEEWCTQSHPARPTAHGSDGDAAGGRKAALSGRHGAHSGGGSYQAGPGAGSAGGDEAGESCPAVEIIHAYFRERYRPQFRRGNAIFCADGAEVPMNVACAVPDSKLIARLSKACDAPCYQGGGVRHNALPGFFKTWAKVAWGDLLGELKDEDEADLGQDAPARDEFRRLVRAAMVQEIVLGDVIGRTGATQTERHSLIGWCEKFAKPGPWRSIRSKKCWCKIIELPEGELRLKVAIRHELFAQVHTDLRLRNMAPTTFARRAAKYGVGRTGGKDNRPHGLNAVILDDDFIAELTEGIPEEEELVSGAT